MYQIRTYPEARAEIAALPTAAALGYAEALGLMRLMPWNGHPLNEDNPDGAVRALVFGPEARGMVTYLILDREQQVDVITVHWAG